MAFSKTPRVLINAEMANTGLPGPCDYDPKSNEKRIAGLTIYDDTKIIMRNVPKQRINYLSKKDTSDVQTKNSRIGYLPSSVQKTHVKCLQKEITCLKNCIAEKETNSQLIIQQSEDLKAELEKRLATSSQTIDTLEDTNKAKQFEMDKLNARQADLDGIIAQLTADMVTKDNSLLESRELNNQQNGALSTANAECQRLELLNSEHFILITKVESEKDDLLTKMSSITELYQKEAEKYAEKTSEVDSLAISLKEQKSELTYSEECLRLNEEKLEKITISNNDIRGEMDGLRHELRTANEKMAETIDLNNCLKISLDESNEAQQLRLREHSTERHQMTSENEQLKRDVQQLKKEHHKMEIESKRSSAGRQTEVFELQEKVKSLQAEHIEKVNRIKKNNTKEKQCYKAELTEHLKSIEELKAEITEIRFEVVKSDERSDLVEQRLTSEIYLRQEMNRLIEISKGLEHENELLAKEICAEKEQIKEMVQLHLDYEEELNEHWEEIVNNVEDIRRLQDNLEETETSKSAMALQLEDLQSNKQTLENDLEETQAKLKCLQSTNMNGLKTFKEKYLSLQEDCTKREATFYQNLAKIESSRDKEREEKFNIQSKLNKTNQLVQKLTQQINSEKDKIEESSAQLNAANASLKKKNEEDGRFEQEAEKYKKLYEELAEKYKNDRFLVSDISQEKSMLSVQNHELTKNLSEKENLLSSMNSHQNKKQKLFYLERLREENHVLRREKTDIQTANKKLQSRNRIIEEELRFYRAEKPMLFSVKK